MFVKIKEYSERISCGIDMVWENRSRGDMVRDTTWRTPPDTYKKKESTLSLDIDYFLHLYLLVHSDSQSIHPSIHPSCYNTCLTALLESDSIFWVWFVVTQYYNPTMWEVHTYTVVHNKTIHILYDMLYRYMYTSHWILLSHIKGTVCIPV